VTSASKNCAISRGIGERLYHEALLCICSIGSGHLKEAQNAMNLAWENLPSGFTGWEKNFLITEARLQLIQRDLEASAKTAKKAFNLATVGSINLAQALQQKI
jgi:hypothetical protein